MRAEAARRSAEEAIAGMEFVTVPAGSFRMGSKRREASSDERPLTRVAISRAIGLGKYEVTQGQWEAVMGWNRSMNSGCERCPVEYVSWDEVQEFVGRLNALAGGNRYRLPAEAEWEYAARAGTSGDRYAPNLDAIAWYEDNTGGLKGRTQPVGAKAPNAWGLHDMLGNVSEWVQDWYGRYPGDSVTDPRGPGSGSDRVIRGGNWLYGARECRASYRDELPPDYRQTTVGFRLVRMGE